MLCVQVQKDYKFKLILLDDREFKFSYKVPTLRRNNLFIQRVKLEIFCDHTNKKGAQKCEQILIDIAKILGLEEKDYFGFRFTDADMQSVRDLG